MRQITAAEELQLTVKVVDLATNISIASAFGAAPVFCRWQAPARSITAARLVKTTLYRTRMLNDVRGNPISG